MILLLEILTALPICFLTFIVGYDIVIFISDKIEINNAKKIDREMRDNANANYFRPLVNKIVNRIRKNQ